MTSTSNAAMASTSNGVMANNVRDQGASQSVSGVRGGDSDAEAAAEASSVSEKSAR